MSQLARPDTADPATGPGGGLSGDEAAARLAADGPNELPRAQRPTLRSRFARELREPMAVLLLVAAAVSGLLLDELLDAAAIAVIVLVNATIALVQEGRAERALEALERLDAQLATVVRGGRREVVDASTLVVGDLVLVQAGDRVPADLDLVDAHGLEVDEAVLTGESLPVTKAADGVRDASVPIGDRSGRAHHGTLVTRGAGTGTVVATGSRTELGAIAQQLQSVQREPTPLQRQLAGLTGRLGVAALLVAGGTFAVLVALGRSDGLDEAFLTAVALAVAAVPEGLAAVTTVALALGVGRMAQHGAIVRRLPAVETLGATDVLVVDKTGTLTENRMALAAVVDASGEAHTGGRLPAWLHGPAEDVMVLCNDATAEPPTGDPTERGLLELTPPAQVEGRRAERPRLALAPFTSERRRMGSVHHDGEGLVLLVKGAPEVVLPRCTSCLGATGTTPLDRAAADRLLALAEERATRGERLLALALRTLADVPGDVEPEEAGLELVALVALRDPPRTSAPTSVAAVRGAGVRLVMATGDHPATARAIAREVGVLAGDMDDATAPDDELLGPTVHARVDPDRKLRLVEAFQRAGHVVAMTGDGVNDAPALRRADIGVALGGTGSDVAREAADLVITDDDLATIVVAIREGRGIWENLRKVIDYLVTSNLCEVAVVLSALFLVPALGVPLLPLQLLWINLLTDGLPALALGVDPTSDALMDRPPRSSTARLLDRRHLTHLARRAAVLAAGALATLLVAHHVLDLAPDAARTVLFSTLVLTQVLYAYVVRRRDGASPGRNRWLLASAVGALGLHVLIVVAPFGQRVFDTVALDGRSTALVVLGAVVAPAALWLHARLTPAHTATAPVATAPAAPPVP